jgi:hypothetical protein
MCHRIRAWNQVGFCGQSGLRVGLGDKRPVAFDPFRTCAAGRHTNDQHLPDEYTTVV